MVARGDRASVEQLARVSVAAAPDRLEAALSCGHLACAGGRQIVKRGDPAEAARDGPHVPGLTGRSELAVSVQPVKGADDKRRAWLALVLAAVAAISMPLAWQPIVLEVGKHGETSWIGEGYPPMTLGAALAGALVLLLAATTGRRAPVTAWCMVAGGFAMAAFLVAVHSSLSLPA
jgi:hypothetical protein